MTWIALLGLVLGGDKKPMESITVDAMELNTVCDREHKPMFTQIIVWNIQPDDGKLHNLGWKIVRLPSEEPWPIRADLWICFHVCEQTRSVLIVKSGCMRYTQTQHDRERADTVDYWDNDAPNVFNMQSKKARVGG
jgi:hypothetical protein